MSKRQKKRRPNAWLITIAALFFTVAVGFLAWTQLRAYENGVMEVYALQQDGYVQLVLDQINLNKGRSNDEIINDILGTLDASSNKYWTLSQKDTLIFVKDVMETNRYKGFTTATYFVSDSAREFIDALQTNRVIHRTIQIGERYFVASGVQFQYRNDYFRVCLLTSAEIVLDQNAYLSAKINICVLALIELAAFLLTTITLSALAQRWRRRYDREAQDNTELRLTVERLNEALNQKGLYDTRQMAFQAPALSQLLEKLEFRQVWPLNFILLACDSDEVRDRFLIDSQITLDRQVIRVLPDDQHILLITVKSRELADSAALLVLREPGLHLVGNLTLTSRPEGSLKKAYQDFYENRVNIYGAQAVS